jgi:hypothetical protein
MEPLHWPDGYKVEQYVPKEWFEHLPFSLVFFWLSKPVWVYKDRFQPVIIEVGKQLITRPEPSQSIWGSTPERVNMAQYVCAVIKDTYAWPNSHFIPEDPLDVVFQMPFGEVDLVECIVRLQEDLSINIQNKEAQQWSGKRLGNIVDFLLAKQGG